MTSQLVHISQTRCGKCEYLAKNKLSKGYHCKQNRRLDDYMPSFFAVKCANFKRKKVKVEA